LWLVCRRLLLVQSPDEFYTSMGSLSQEMLDGTVVNEDDLIQVTRDNQNFFARSAVEADNVLK
jgi:hypothetical protein